MYRKMYVKSYIYIETKRIFYEDSMELQQWQDNRNRTVNHAIISTKFHLFIS